MKKLHPGDMVKIYGEGMQYLRDKDNWKNGYKIPFQKTDVGMVLEYDTESMCYKVMIPAGIGWIIDMHVEGLE